MLKKCRHKIVNHLWKQYLNNSQQTQRIEKALLKYGIIQSPLDHFAIIDLPGPNTGIYHMKEIFLALGFLERGKDYLAEKQNDFMWLTEESSLRSKAEEALPQAVIADFRLAILPPDVKNIIVKYASLSMPTPVFNIKKLAEHLARGDSLASEVLYTVVTRYFAGRDWPLPTVKEYETVKEFNELLAWVLVFGRKPNHFTYSVHLMKQFNSLEEFTRFVQDEADLPLNEEGGILKGGPAHGIQQGSTQGSAVKVMLSDGEIEIATDFVEFVWRYPQHATAANGYWDDYFTGFVAKFADRVIESLYE